MPPLNWIQIAKLAAFLVVFGMGWYVHSQIAEAHLKDALESQEQQLILQCQNSKKITEEVSHDYQTKIAALTARVNALRMRPARCLVPTPIPSAGRDDATGAGIHAGQDGVSTTFLLDYAALAEKQRLQLLGCQDFINRIK